MSPEVLIYLQSVKNFLKTNEETRRYFLDGVEEEIFYNEISEISQQNYDKDGEAMLTKEQFESIRKKLIIDTISKKEHEFSEGKIFFELNGFGKIYLN